MLNKKFTLHDLSQLTDSKLVGDPTYCVTNVESLELATPSDASFLANPRYEKAMLNSQAGVVFVKPATKLPQGRNFLLTEDPSKAFQLTAEAFYGTGPQLTGFIGIHPTAVIHPSAVIGKNCQIGPHVVIDEGANIGDGTYIGAGCFIGPYVTIGLYSLLHPRVVIREHCVIGKRVILQPGAVIGGCGFGYLTDKEGNHSKLNQLGGVVVGDDVEVGANTTIDRSRFKNTEIGSGTKIDNLVQIGHGVSIGKNTIIVAQTGIAGSARIDRNVTIGGQVAITGHIKIGAGVTIAGRSGVTKSIPDKAIVGGLPARPLAEYNRSSVYLQNIEKYVKKIKDLESRLAELEKSCQKRD